MNRSLSSVEVPAPMVPIVQLIAKMIDKIQALPDARKLEATVHEDFKQIERQSYGYLYWVQSSTRHRRRMRYPEFKSMGLPIGSGAIEGTCKNLIKGHMAGVGMRWDADEGIELMMALRVRMFNEHWEDLWKDD